MSSTAARIVGGVRRVCGPTVVVRSIEGEGCSGEGRPGVVIVIVGDVNVGEENGSFIRDPPYREWGMHGDISDLGWAVGTDVGIGRGWQRRGRRCSRSCRLGIVSRILGCRIDAQMDVVIAAFDGCRGLDLTPALPLAPFRPPTSSPGCSPSTAPMPYLPSYGCNVLGPSLDISSSSSSSPCLSSSPSCPRC